MRDLAVDRRLPSPQQPAGTNLFPLIEHIVVLMNKNHTFDNYFGMLRRGDGFTLDADGQPVNAHLGDLTQDALMDIGAVGGRSLEPNAGIATLRRPIPGVGSQIVCRTFATLFVASPCSSHATGSRLTCTDESVDAPQGRRTSRIAPFSVAISRQIIWQFTPRPRRRHQRLVFNPGVAGGCRPPTGPARPAAPAPSMNPIFRPSSADTDRASLNLGLLVRPGRCGRCGRQRTGVAALR